jgi:hypothetical protein
MNTLAAAVDEAPIGIGHNLPPLADQLAEEIAPDKQRADELIEAAASSKIADDRDAEKVTTLVALIRAHEKAIDGKREERKRPFLENSRLVDATFGALARPLAIARAGADGRGGLVGMLTQWQHKREEEARIERQRIEAEQRARAEEAERARLAAEEAKNQGKGSITAELDAIRAQEDADRLARQAETIRPEPIRSAVGAVAMRREIGFEITDERKAISWLYKNRRSELMRDARALLEKHLRSLGVDAAGTADIPGVAITISSRAQVR